MVFPFLKRGGGAHHDDDLNLVPKGDDHTLLNSTLVHTVPLIVYDFRRTVRKVSLDSGPFSVDPLEKD